MEYLRKVTVEDMDLLYRWANDSTVRNNAFSTEPISYENHQKWFTERMEDPDTVMFLLMVEEEPVGQIRVTLVGERALIDYSVAEEYRGKGYGKRMLALLEAVMKEFYPEIKCLVAQVKAGNDPSRNVFLKNDFQEHYVEYVKTIGEA